MLQLYSTQTRLVPKVFMWNDPFGWGWVQAWQSSQARNWLAVPLGKDVKDFNGFIVSLGCVDRHRGDPV